MKHYYKNEIYESGDNVLVGGIMYINCTDNWFKKYGGIDVIEIEGDGVSGLYTIDENGNAIEPYANQTIKHNETYENEFGEEESYTWEEPVPYKYFLYVNKSIEPDCTLEELKSKKIFEIEMYDMSDNVNGFTYNGQTMWIDKATRVGLVNAVDSAILLGKEEITFGISGISVTLPCTTAKAMLAQLELYALDCYNTTLAHKNAIEEFTSIEDVESFDITADYPDKLKF